MKLVESRNNTRAGRLSHSIKNLDSRLMPIISIAKNTTTNLPYYKKKKLFLLNETKRKNSCRSGQELIVGY